MSTVLVVDDEESICWGLKRRLSESGHVVRVAASAEEALASVEVESPDAVVLDVRLPGMDGLTAMQKLQQLAGPLPIVVITAFGTLDVAVTAMQNGAFDYLAKPFDLEQAAAVIDRAVAQGPARFRETACEQPWPNFLGRSRAMQDVFKRIALVAPTDSAVLITGESGTGKELVARSIHRHSRRAGEPFVPIHLASLSPTLVESELFGHVRGAFTGAEAARKGLLELADGATVFFDEAGDIPPAVQVKLLRVLEQGHVTPVGDTQARATSFRVIAATNRNLRADSDEASIRRDLYFRLAAFEIELPPLRERPDDVPQLAEYFLAQTLGVNRTACGFSERAMAELCRRSWPGNVRQLRHAVEHGALLARGGQIAIEHLPPESDAGSGPAVERELQTLVRQWARQQFGDQASSDIYQALLQQVEPPLFEAALAAADGNRAAAAAALGIDRATLRKKLRRHTDRGES